MSSYRQIYCPPAKLLHAPPVVWALNVGLQTEVRPGLPLDLGHPWSSDDVEELDVDILSTLSNGLLTYC